MATQHSTTTATEYERVYKNTPQQSKALEAAKANAKRAEAMIATLEEFGEQRWIGTNANNPWQHVHQLPNREFALSFTNDPYLFKSKQAVEHLVCSEPIDAKDALTWYKAFLADCHDSIRIFTR
jgi:hypothetical protein